MSFLAPLFLLGTLAVALPVVFHLIRRSTRERQQFSSLMFLMPTPPRITRRSKLEHLLLLALRCAVIGLLALGFARPFIKTASSAASGNGPGRKLAILLDTSASMKRESLWDEARRLAENELREAKPGDQVAVFTFDDQLHPLVTFEQWKNAGVADRSALALQQLAAAKPGWGKTKLGLALTTVAEALDDAETAAGTARQIVVISDLQSGSQIEPLQSYHWLKEVQVRFEAVKARRPSNAGLQILAESEDGAPQASNAVTRVKVMNAADSRQDRFRIGWAGADGKTFLTNATEVYVPPGQSRVLALAALPAGTPADRVVLRGDDDDFDNTVYVVSPESARITILHLTTDLPGNRGQMFYFLRRAFQETRRQVAQVELLPPDGNMAQAGASAALVVVSDALPETQTAGLQAMLAAGKMVLVVMKNAAMAPTLAKLAGVPSVRSEEVRPPQYAMLGEIDFRHPLFAPFADPRYSDFTKIHFWKYRRLDAAAFPAARMLARFDSGDPALLEMPVGKGRLLVLASGWQPEDSQLALSSKFVPLMYSLLEQSGRALVAATQFLVDDAVPMHLAAGATVSLRLPDQSQAQVPAGEAWFRQTRMPGIYEITAPAATRRFAVNLDPAESRTAPLPIEDLERMGVPVSRPAAEASVAAARLAVRQNAELENRQKLWRWLVVACLLMVLAETWLGGRMGHNPRLETQTTL